jgi:ribosomal protein S15
MGLTKSVNRRKKLLAYLKKTNPDSYNKVIKQLNLRK